MDYKVHTVGAVASAYGIYYLGNEIGIEINPIYFVGGSLLGGLLPDIDHPESKLGRITQPLSILIMVTVGHRTLTHSLLFSVIIGVLVAVFNKYLGFGIFIGMISHIMLDLLTPKTNGVAFLFPFNKKKIKIL